MDWIENETNSIIIDLAHSKNGITGLAMSLVFVFSAFVFFIYIVTTANVSGIQRVISILVVIFYAIFLVYFTRVYKRASDLKHNLSILGRRIGRESKVHPRYSAYKRYQKLNSDFKKVTPLYNNETQVLENRSQEIPRIIMA